MCGDESSQSHSRRVLLASDIDNTLVMTWTKDGAAPPAPAQLMRFAEDHDIAIVGVTGMAWEAVAERIEAGNIPPLEMICTDVGTEIRYVADTDATNADPDTTNDVDVLCLPDGSSVSYERDRRYGEMLIEAYGFDKERLTQKMADLINVLGIERSDTGPHLDLQFQTGAKNVAADGALHIGLWAFDESPEGKAVETIAQRLRDETGQTVAWCEEKNYNSRLTSTETRKKYCIDVLPAAKDEAVRFAADAIGANVVVVAGDSGNDWDMLSNVGVVKIVVGNSNNDLLARVCDRLGISSQRSVGGCVCSVDGDNGTECWFVDSADRVGPSSVLAGLEATTEFWKGA